MDFLKNNKRISFKLDEVDFESVEHTTTVKETESSISVTYAFDDGLTLTSIAKKHEAFGAWEWVNFIENTGKSPSRVISELWDADVLLPLEHEPSRHTSAYLSDPDAATKIYAPSGSTWSRREFYCDLDYFCESDTKSHIYPGSTKAFSCRGGRSSDGNAPFFRVSKNGVGYIFAIGWSGQWSCEIKRTNDEIGFRSKISDTRFRVMPGEHFRTSSIVIMPYSDEKEAHNLWRRLLKSDFSIIGEGKRAEQAPLFAGVWGGMKTSSALSRLEKIKENDLPFEYIWMDAGWYGGDTKPTHDEFEGDWYSHTGDWQVSREIHPEGLVDFSNAVHAAGKKFLLWFEPERVIKGTPIEKEHPEYLLSDGNPQNNNLLLNLGNEKAYEYCLDVLSRFIEKLEIDCYRNDFNFSPLPFWQNNDEPDRCGITEIKYINGLYKLWSTLLERFPGLIIDDCASGGRRIDIEMLRLSVPLWRSDVMCPANYDITAVQCNSQSFNLWMPYSGTGSGRPLDEYRIRSAYASSMTTNYSFSERDEFCDTPDKIAFLKKYLNEYLEVRPYFSEDFYPLTPFSDSRGTWCASQFNRPEKGDGIVEVFKRELSPYETAIFKLYGIDEAADYIFEDFDSGEIQISGKALTETGLKITVNEPRKAKIFKYRKA